MIRNAVLRTLDDGEVVYGHANTTHHITYSEFVLTLLSDGL
jgi:transcriptional antiterminator Rof (Rho-off)